MLLQERVNTSGVRIKLCLHWDMDSGRAWVRRGPACLHYISQTRIFQDLGPPGTVRKTVPGDFGLGPD